MVKQLMEVRQQNWEDERAKVPLSRVKKDTKLDGIFMTGRRGSARVASKMLKKNMNFKLEREYTREQPYLRRKIYYLDHTAEVLENLRRITEAREHRALLHSIRFRKAALKHEARKLVNLVPKAQFPLLGAPSDRPSGPAPPVPTPRDF